MTLTTSVSVPPVHSPTIQSFCLVLQVSLECPMVALSQLPALWKVRSLLLFLFLGLSIISVALCEQKQKPVFSI